MTRSVETSALELPRPVAKKAKVNKLHVKESRQQRELQTPRPLLVARARTRGAEGGKEREREGQRGGQGGAEHEPTPDRQSWGKAARDRSRCASPRGQRTVAMTVPSNAWGTSSQLSWLTTASKVGGTPASFQTLTGRSSSTPGHHSRSLCSGHRQVRTFADKSRPAFGAQELSSRHTFRLSRVPRGALLPSPATTTNY